ncbi:S41 family peptidase [Lutispora thermophila]|uniref:Tricorn protease C1 domain-containing protein n=1 Tax=Lutispora thermophila DSM 19022 TaxID=1122184 RepID=A0A1M6B5A4_9FIRM|nr:S41 family peptidase [Lutispora thermophila]SHI43911.1 Tricorn protease C1 domain-containing protein [Lutispora thermophila DSM 19022]
MVRKRFMGISAVLLITVFILMACTDEETAIAAEDAATYGIIETHMSTEEKLEDFYYMYKLLEDNYPFFNVNKRLYNVDWLKNKKKYEKMIKITKNDAEFFVAIDKILNDLNNPHTHVFNGNVYRSYYKHFYPDEHPVLNYEKSMKRYGFDGNVENIGLDSDFDFLATNDEVLKTAILIENKVAYMKIDSMSYNHIKEDYAKVEKFLKEVKDYEKLIIDIRGNTGGFDDYWKNIVGFLIDDTLKAEYYCFYRGNYRDKYDLYKVPLSKPIRKLDEEALRKFPSEVKEDYDYYTKNLVIVKPWNILDFKGKVYLLVDRYVFSSAEKFASFAKDSGFAILIGEPTGGDRVFAEIPFAYLPNSGLVIRFSAELGINNDGTINMETKTTPHIRVDATPNEDFTKDACIQAAIKD